MHVGLGNAMIQPIITQTNHDLKSLPCQATRVVIVTSMLGRFFELQFCKKEEIKWLHKNCHHLIKGIYIHIIIQPLSLHHPWPNPMSKVSNVQFIIQNSTRLNLKRMYCMSLEIGQISLSIKFWKDKNTIQEWAEMTPPPQGEGPYEITSPS